MTHLQVYRLIDGDPRAPLLADTGPIDRDDILSSASTSPLRLPARNV